MNIQGENAGIVATNEENENLAGLEGAIEADMDLTDENPFEPKPLKETNAKNNCLSEFLPLLQLLWPMLNFSDEILLEGLESNIRYEYPLALMNFFQQRGIYNLDEISIFKSQDFLGAQDADCKALFEFPGFVDLLDKICYFVAWRGGGILKDRIYWYRQNGNGFGGLSAIKAELKVTRRMDAEARASGFYHDYTDETEAEVEGRVSLGIRDVVKLEDSIEQSGIFDLFSKGWSLDGFCHFTSFLSKTLLESGRMTIPLEFIACSAKAREALKNLLGRESEQFSVLGFQFDHRPKRHTFFSQNNFLKRFPDVYSTCFKAMVEGFSSPGCGIMEMALCGLDLGPAYADSLSILFSRDNISQLRVILDPDKIEGDDYEPFDNSDAMAEPPIGVSRLILWGLTMRPQNWKETWKTISKLERLECVALDPRCDEGIMDIDRISMAVNAACSLPRLKILFLQEHECFGEGSVDLTDGLSNLLMTGVIEEITIYGSFGLDDDDDDDGSVSFSYQVDMERFCQSLKENRSLDILYLNTVGIVMGEGVSVARMLVNSMQQSKNTTLARAKICDHKTYYAGTGADSWSGDQGSEYENYEDALQLQDLLKLNNLGLGQILETGATKQVLVACIAESYDCFFHKEEEASFRRQIVDLSKCAALDDGSNNGLGELFKQLLAFPALWSGVGNEELDHFGVVYGLLHARPDLWCNATGDDALVERLKKRQRLGG